MRRGRWCRVTLFLFCANPFWVKTGFHFCAGFVEGLGFGYAVGQVVWGWRQGGMTFLLRFQVKVIQAKASFEACCPSFTGIGPQ